jgi:hypothetical protein
VTRYLKESEAWRRVAEGFAPPFCRVGVRGLCMAVALLGGAIPRQMQKKMHHRVRSYLGPFDFYAYAVGDYFTNDDSDEARAARCMAALWLALDATAEEAASRRRARRRSP